MKSRIPSFLFLFSFVLTALASSGDRSPEFTSCLASCTTNEECFSSSLPFSLRLTRWTCSDNCKYTCMHSLTSSAIVSDQSIHQYYGKWPFWRLWGMQEPASVLFSLLNLWAHVRGWKMIKRRVGKENPMRKYYLRWSLVSINAWFWSAVFHTRDLPSTEKLDYFAAASAIMYALYYTILRLFHLYPRMRLTTRNTPSHIILSALCLLTYLGHITYLTLLPRFDYAYNMAFNLSLGIIHNLLWLLYALPLPSLFSVLPHRFPAFPRSYRPHFVAKAGWLVLLTTLATGLELFDFPPWWRAIDAHALWHLATAPIAVWWYGFLVDDANALSGNGSADGEGWKEQRLL